VRNDNNKNAWKIRFASGLIFDPSATALAEWA
jgi:hypothetical protein